MLTVVIVTDYDQFNELVKKHEQRKIKEPHTKFVDAVLIIPTGSGFKPTTKYESWHVGDAGPAISGYYTKLV